MLIVTGAGTGGVLLLRWYWWRVNAWSEVVAMGTAFVVSVALQAIWKLDSDNPVEFAWIMIITVGITTAAWLGATFLTADRAIMGNNDGQQLVREFPSGKVVLQFENKGGYEGFAFSSSAGLMAYRGYSRPTVSVGEFTMRTPTSAEVTRIARLIQNFDADDYAIREAATKGMKEIGSVAEPALQKAAKEGSSPEVRMRAREGRTAILNFFQRTLSGHAGTVSTMAFSPDGTLLLVASWNGDARLLRAPHPQDTRPLR